MGRADAQHQRSEIPADPLPRRRGLAACHRLGGGKRNKIWKARAGPALPRVDGGEDTARKRHVCGNLQGGQAGAVQLLHTPGVVGRHVRVCVQGNDAWDEGEHDGQHDTT